MPYASTRTSRYHRQFHVGVASGLALLPYRRFANRFGMLSIIPL